MSRRLTREMAMKLFYQMEIGRDFEYKIIDEYIEQNEIGDMDIEYLKDVAYKLIDNMEQVDGVISKYSKGWTIGRISKIDLSILRLAIVEMMYVDEIMSSISINEAVELAKIYGGENSPSFVNGVLGSAANELEK